MKTVWEYSTYDEALHLLHCAHKLSLGFYQTNNFLVLPLGHKLAAQADVFFPDINYMSIPKFWSQVQKINGNKLPVAAEKKLVEAVEDLLIKNNLPAPKFDELKKIWTSAEDEVLQSINSLFGSQKPVIKSITVYPSSFGTSVSFNRVVPDLAEIKMYLRSDRDIYTITEAIITSLIRTEAELDLNLTWEESEAVSDWLVNKSFIGGILGHYQSQENSSQTLKQIRMTQKGRATEESKNFLKKIGLVFSGNSFTTVENKPQYNEKPIVDLTEREEKILISLINKKDDILTFDEIGQTIFANEDEFSLYAIAKTMSRLREKLEANSIPSYLIQTYRGKGYWLKK